MHLSVVLLTIRNCLTSRVTSTGVLQLREPMQMEIVRLERGRFVYVEFILNNVTRVDLTSSCIHWLRSTGPHTRRFQASPTIAGDIVCIYYMVRARTLTYKRMDELFRRLIVPSLYSESSLPTDRPTDWHCGGVLQLGYSGKRRSKPRGRPSADRSDDDGHRCRRVWAAKRTSRGATDRPVPAVRRPGRR